MQAQKGGKGTVPTHQQTWDNKWGGWSAPGPGWLTPPPRKDPIPNAQEARSGRAQKISRIWDSIRRQSSPLRLDLPITIPRP